MGRAMEGEPGKLGELVGRQAVIAGLEQGAADGRARGHGEQRKRQRAFLSGHVQPRVVMVAFVCTVLTRQTQVCGPGVALTPHPAGRAGHHAYRTPTRTAYW
ncbi:hypothetical protein D3C81_1539990 [compost metagenome]